MASEDEALSSPPPKHLSKTFSFSKLNAKAAEFVPAGSGSTSPVSISGASGEIVPGPRPPDVVHTFAGTTGVQLPLRPPFPGAGAPFPGAGAGAGYQYNMGFYGQQHQIIPRPFTPAAMAALTVPLPGDLEKAKAPGLVVGLSDDVVRKILNQVEYYFSDLNLATTDHLIRFMHKDPEGYVPISVVSSFKKIKSSIGSISQLANILRCSEKLVVSDDGKKVKRTNQLTESDMEELQSRIVVAENLPGDHGHQSLMKMFSAVGSVKSIRTCQPQNSNGGASAASRTAKTEGSHYSNKLHAFAEYESAELAEKAVTELNDKNNWRNGLKVRLLISRPKANSSQTRMKKSFLENDPDALPLESDANDLGVEDDGEHKKTCNRGKGKGRGRPQYQSSKSRGGIMGSPPSVNILASHEQVTGNKQGSVPRMPDGTRGFSMGRGKPVAVKSA